MKQIIKYGMLCSLIFMMCFNMPAAAAGNEDDEAVRTINTMNEIRAVFDIPELSHNDALTTTASLHNRYMEFNDSYSSIEESGKLYYRGRYPWDRASYNGYPNAYVFEVLNCDVATFAEGLNQLIENPYARYGIMDPLYSDLGMHTYEGYTTYLFGGSGRDYSYELVYPYDEQEDISVTYENKYIIDPYAGIRNAPDYVGVPITYSVYSSQGKVLDFSNLEVSLLNTRTNEEVDIEVETSMTDRNLTNTIAILPLEPYSYGTTYEVSIRTLVRFDKSLTFEGESSWHTRYFNYVGSFTTEETAASATTYSYVTRTEFVEELMKASDYIIRDSLEIIFPDVNINAPNYKYIYTAYVNQIILGYGDGYYRPNANISREQAYTILVRNYENMYGTIELNASDRYLSFSDKADISRYALENIYKAKKIGLLNDNRYEFKPGVYIITTEFEQMMQSYERVNSKQPIGRRIL